MITGPHEREEEARRGPHTEERLRVKVRQEKRTHGDETVAWRGEMRGSRGVMA